MESRVKTFKFKKIDFFDKGRKINQPEVTITLKYDEENRPCLSICGNIWNNTHTDIVCGGQCLDEMIKFDSISSDLIFNKVYYLWTNYHLNGCGSKRFYMEIPEDSLNTINELLAE